MVGAIRRLTKPFICIAFVLAGVDVNAQVDLIQQAIDKMEGYKNFSYRCVYKQQDYTSDTTEIQKRNILLKSPEDKNFGYLFSIETLNKGNKFPLIDLYNGQDLIQIDPSDSTYFVERLRPYAFQSILLNHLKMLKGFFERRPSEIAGDTIIDGNACSHLIVNTYDTVINKEHYYVRIHVFIDKLSGLPDCIITRSRNDQVGNGITNYYTEFRYSDYKFDQDNIDVTSMTIPKGFHPAEDGPPLPALLASGEVAPDWTLYSAEGTKMSLSQMKGKIVLLDFFYIGCGGCMLSLKPLNRLHEKYKNVAFISMTDRDSKESVAKFGKDYNIKYPIYINAGDVVKSYHVNGAPTFYFIDKEGKIANVFMGYDDDFEEKVGSIFDDMLSK